MVPVCWFVRLGRSGSGGTARRLTRLQRQRGLAAQPEPADELTVAPHVPRAEVAELATTASHKLQEPAPRVVVVRVRAQVFGEVVDALGQERDLHLRGAGVSLVGREVANDLLSAFRVHERSDADSVLLLLRDLVISPHIHAPTLPGPGGNRARLSRADASAPTRIPAYASIAARQRAIERPFDARDRGRVRCR